MNGKLAKVLCASRSLPLTSTNAYCPVSAPSEVAPLSDDATVYKHQAEALTDEAQDKEKTQWEVCIIQLTFLLSLFVCT